MEYLDHAHRRVRTKAKKIPKSLWRLLDGRGTKRSAFSDKEKILESS